MNQRFLQHFSFFVLFLLELVFIQNVYSNPSFNNDKMSVTLGKASLIVEIADTSSKRSIGLMHRKNLGKNEGMLFAFPSSDLQSFWMKNTLIPLSIGYFDENGILLEIYDMKPNQTDEIYNSKKKAIYALEVNQGWFKKNGILPGAVLIMEKSIYGR
ncbi:MAG: hypothetical protein CK427_10725 [Leptospira sp.]|nr:MAG: hypothetical protein CK427_10725 [Leptospira sp.]